MTDISKYPEGWEAVKASITFFETEAEKEAYMKTFVRLVTNY